MKIESDPIFFDIDGTLTKSPDDPSGEPCVERIEAVRALIAKGLEVVIWSARGTTYARNFCREHRLEALAIGKPAIMVDDKPTIRAPGRLTVIDPDVYFS